MSSREVQETAEAVCGALHRFAFAHIGESGNGASTWFTRGVSPKDIRVEVVRGDVDQTVMVNVEFRNLHTAPAVLGRITAQIDTRGAKADVMEATEQAVLRCLEIFRDVLEGKGVAGPEIIRARTPLTVTADSHVPSNDDEEQEAGLW